MSRQYPVVAFFIFMALGAIISTIMHPTGRSTFKLKKDEWTCTKSVQISSNSTEECLQWSKK